MGIFSEVAERDSFNIAGIVLTPDKRFNPICSSCRQKCSIIHQTRSRIVRDIPLGCCTGNDIIQQRFRRSKTRFKGCEIKG